MLAVFFASVNSTTNGCFYDTLKHRFLPIYIQYDMFHPPALIQPMDDAEMAYSEHRQATRLRI